MEKVSCDSWSSVRDVKGTSKGVVSEGEAEATDVNFPPPLGVKKELMKRFIKDGLDEWDDDCASLQSVPGFVFP